MRRLQVRDSKKQGRRHRSALNRVVTSALVFAVSLSVGANRRAHAEKKALELDEVEQIVSLAPGDGSPPFVFKVVARAGTNRCPAPDGTTSKTFALNAPPGSDRSYLNLDFVGAESINHYNPSVSSKYAITIGFFEKDSGKPILRSAAHFSSARLFVEGQADPVYSVNDTDLQADRFCVELSSRLHGTLDDLNTVKNNTLLKLEIAWRGAHPTTVYAKMANTWQSYVGDPFGTDVVGLWAPVGLFGTNFTRTASGIAFSALPVGGALGGKLWFGDRFYLGFSAMASWAIAKTADKSTDPMTGAESTSNTTTASSAGLGGLLDIGGYMYLGEVYIADLTDKDRSPGWFTVVGIAPSLLKLIATGR
jgi:hypothetical protein